MRAAQAEFRRRDEIPDLRAQARLRVGDAMSEVLKWLGSKCRRPSSNTGTPATGRAQALRSRRSHQDDGRVERRRLVLRKKASTRLTI